MMMHASEIPQGNYWQKVIGQEALKVLGPSDYCGVVHWDDFTGGDNWLWRVNGKGLARLEDRQKIWLAKFDRMQPGDMPQFDPAMNMALKELIPNPASVKHMIIISDGDPSPPSATTLAQYKKNNIRISTCAVGSHGPATSKVLQDIATASGGKYYAVTNPKALPRIFQIEARRVARPLVKEKAAGMPVAVDDPSHEMLAEVDAVPPVTGYVLTSVKENPLVEVLMREKGADPENSTILRVAVRIGQNGRLHHRCGPPLGGPMDELGELRQVLQPDDPLGHAARQRRGQIQHRQRREGRQGARRRHRAGQER
jgi:hypothetical protein